jgi:hypothetical protein
MSRARAKGVKIGRPRLAAELRQEITQRAAKGETVYAIAKALRPTMPLPAKLATDLSSRGCLFVQRLAHAGERDPVRLHDGALERLLPPTTWREAS